MEAMLPSEVFESRTKRHYLYNIMPIENIASVIQHGILCFDEVQQTPHMSVALTSVQDRRDRVILPNGNRLHSYANAYFAYNNPMLYKRKDQNRTLCILVLSKTILDIDGCVVTDRNAATNIVRFYSPAVGLYKIDFDRVFAQFWIHDNDELATANHKAIKCAEILVPGRIEPRLIRGAYVFDDNASSYLKNNGFPYRIIVDRSKFFE